MKATDSIIHNVRTIIADKGLKQKKLLKSLDMIIKCSATCLMAENP